MGMLKKLTQPKLISKSKKGSLYGVQIYKHELSGGVYIPRLVYFSSKSLFAVHKFIYEIKKHNYEIELKEYKSMANWYKQLEETQKIPIDPSSF